MNREQDKPEVSRGRLVPKNDKRKPEFPCVSLTGQLELRDMTQARLAEERLIRQIQRQWGLRRI